MGLYIPPTGGSNNNNNNKPDSDDKNSNLKPDDNKFLFYTRPSIGLKIWGPLVPASDYLPGLYSLTAFQGIMGLIMFKNVRAIWNVKTIFARFSKTLSALAGAYLIFNTGLEISRLSLPYDPWYDEAKKAREDAIKKGDKPNFWFGPWDFKPMSFQQWNKLADQWIMEAEKKLDRGEDISFNSLKKGPDSNLIKSKFDQYNTNAGFHSIYIQIREMNLKRNSQILEQLENKSFKDILPNYQTYVNPSFDRPSIVLPEDNQLEDDFDLEEAWELNDPWVSLGYDTDYIVRFIPKFRWANNKKKVEEDKTTTQSI